MMVYPGVNPRSHDMSHQCQMKSCLLQLDPRDASVADEQQLSYFPPPCPDLNPQEHVWARERDGISHNRLSRHFQLQPLVADFETYLKLSARIIQP